MKILTLGLLAIISTGCGIKPLEDLIYKKTSPTRHATNPIFQEYLDRLGLTTNTPIIFNARQIGIGGTCTKYSDGYKEIEIDPTYWNDINLELRLELLAHELGHCDKNLGHNNEVRDDGCPVSIMNATAFGDICFNRHYNEYMEIFN